jgi:alpha-glucosidase
MRDSFMQDLERGLVKHDWWKTGIIYEIYLRSFQDSNGDGIGDLNGVVQRLDYLSWLGVDAVWISPFHPSPMADFGYDISDYLGVEPVFGKVADVDRLVRAAHDRHLKVILDFVPNHTSDQHPWFQQSRASRLSSKRDWYIWRDPGPGGGPPNNWISQFGGPAWTFDPATGQYYLHSFLREQPDLNWRNSAVREAMFDVLRFWLARGIDGFRVDVMWLLIKDEHMRDNPLNPAYELTQPDIHRTLSVYNADRPEIHALIAQLRAVLDQYPDRVLIGEIYLPVERLVAYYGDRLSGAQLPFNFALIHAAWNAKTIASLIAEYEHILPAGGWPNWVLGNHDQPRIAARVGAAQARIAAMLLLTLRGTPTMYYGDEIGMPSVEVPPEVARDAWGKNEPGLGVGRDPSRTPMQWDDRANAGFSSARPWLPIEACYPERNVARLSLDPQSILSLYHRLIELRRAHRVLQVGAARAISAENDVLTYERVNAGQRMLMMLNFSAEPRLLPVPQRENACVLLSTHMDRKGSCVPSELRANEGVIVEMGPATR